MMKALIILAHGSSRSETVQEIHSLISKVRRKAEGIYQFVEYAFLELQTPDLLMVIDKMTRKGVNEIIVLPYFLNSGKHVIKDIPNIIETATERYHHCVFKITPCIGKLKNMPDLILEQSKAY